MKDSTERPMATETPPQSLAAKLDTTSGSIFHLWSNLLERVGVTSGFMPAALYLSNVMLQFVPLLIAAWIGPVPLIATSGAQRIPFLLDFSALSSFLVAYPWSLFCC